MLDRDLQRHILTELSALYPRSLYGGEIEPLGEETALRANLSYLNDHGLIAYKETVFVSGDFSFDSAKITARGLDFLADDGGLSAILGVVTVKLHEETIRSLLLAKVDALDAPAEVKTRLADAIRSLPAKGIEAAALDLVKNGLDHLPQAASHLMRLLGLG